MNFHLHTDRWYATATLTHQELLGHVWRGAWSCAVNGAKLTTGVCWMTSLDYVCDFIIGPTCNVILQCMSAVAGFACSICSAGIIVGHCMYLQLLNHDGCSKMHLTVIRIGITCPDGTSQSTWSLNRDEKRHMYNVPLSYCDRQAQ